MKKLLVVALILIVLSPALAFAGSSTDAALGLGAFAVFNQLLSGTGVFGGLLGRPAIVAPVVVAPPPPVTIFQPVPVVYAPPPQVVVVQPAPVVVAPRGEYYAPAPVYGHAPHRIPVARGWCPPGHMKHGRCY
jgi:hypothetical protein